MPRAFTIERAVAVVCIASATLVSSQSSGPNRSASAPTLTGCLAKSAAGSRYSLKNAKYPKGIEVKVPADYQGDVGHIVTLTGQWGVYPRPGSDGTISIGAGGSATMSNMVHIFVATGVTNVGPACISATTAPAK